MWLEDTFRNWISPTLATVSNIPLSKLSFKDVSDVSASLGDLLQCLYSLIFLPLSILHILYFFKCSAFNEWLFIFFLLLFQNVPLLHEFLMITNTEFWDCYFKNAKLTQVFSNLSLRLISVLIALQPQLPLCWRTCRKSLYLFSIIFFSPVIS